jgi:hypothetical protein
VARFIGELVVGAPCYDHGAQLRQGRVVDHRPERAGRKDVDLGIIDGVRVGDRFGRKGASSLLDQFAANVRHHQLRAGLRQQSAEIPADIAEALDGDANAGQFVPTHAMPDCGPDARKAAERGARRRIAGAAEPLRQADHVVGYRLDLGHVVDIGADVLASNIAAAKPVDRASDAMQQGRRLLSLRIRDHDHLGAAERHARHRRLQAHALRQPQHVAQRGHLILIG